MQSNFRSRRPPFRCMRYLTSSVSKFTNFQRTVRTPSVLEHRCDCFTTFSRPGRKALHDAWAPPQAFEPQPEPEAEPEPERNPAAVAADLRHALLRLEPLRGYAFITNPPEHNETSESFTTDSTWVLTATRG
jgi:hypothetical protein